MKTNLFISIATLILITFFGCNTINDEWLIRDQGSIVRQLGWEPKAYAADLIEREGGKVAVARV